MIKIINLILLPMILSGCKKEVLVSYKDYVGNELVLEQFINGEKVLEKKIKSETIQYKEIARWIENNKTKEWSFSLVTFAPNIIIRGNGFSLNYLKNGTVVLNEWQPIVTKTRQLVLRNNQDPLLIDINKELK